MPICSTKEGLWLTTSMVPSNLLKIAADDRLRFRIEMVGRFVQNQQIGPCNKTLHKTTRAFRRETTPTPFIDVIFIKQEVAQNAAQLLIRYSRRLSTFSKTVLSGSNCSSS